MFTNYSKYGLPRSVYHLVYQGFCDPTMAVKKVVITEGNCKLPLTVGNLNISSFLLPFFLQIL